MLKRWRILDRNVTGLVGVIASVASYALVQAVIGSDNFGDAKDSSGFAALVVVVLLEDNAVIGDLGAGRELFIGSPTSSKNEK